MAKTKPKSDQSENKGKNGAKTSAAQLVELNELYKKITELEKTIDQIEEEQKFRDREEKLKTIYGNYIKEEDLKSAEDKLEKAFEEEEGKES